MSTLFIGNNAIRLPIVESTNTFAHDLLKNENPPDGTIILADEQSKGRGQRENSWQSEGGKNLTFSLILYPNSIASDKQFFLTQVIALAITDWLVSELNSDFQVKIKWPNDVLVGNRKIAGVLIENSLRGNWISSSIIGIGLNINQKQFELENATSLCMLTGCEYDLKICLSRLCQCIEVRYLQLHNKKTFVLQADYLTRLFRLNETHKFEIEHVLYDGKIIGVNEQGKLRIQLNSNSIVSEFGLKEIKFIL
jgi:BirA family transcriptional regulator, biotin operon repressor / biotin---[acetyl-CoA-carboxylase] ligase